MHQNEFFFSDLFFIFDISISKPLKKTKKSINLMPFQTKSNFEKHLKAEVVPNTPLFWVVEESLLAVVFLYFMSLH
jgi:hypothetical protein